jgi:P27 family predicted phage terminase small subunit
MRRLPGCYPEQQPSAHTGGKPKRPKHLSPVAEEKWAEMVKILRARGTLTKGDGPALEIYCESFARWRAMLDEIANEGAMVESTVLTSSGTPITKRIINPAVKAASQLENSLRAMLREFSATPASREKTKTVRAPLNKQPLAPDSIGATTDFDAAWDEAGKQLKKSKEANNADELGGAEDLEGEGGGHDE